MKSLSSSAGDRVRELKRDLVLQVYLGRGLFWEAVNRARIVQGVEAEASLPRPALAALFGGRPPNGRNRGGQRLEPRT